MKVEEPAGVASGLSAVLGGYDPGRNPYYELLADYETLVRLARRCAYDLRHVVDELPADSYFVTSAGMRERAEMWVGLFAKGNPGKDYRHRITTERDGLASKLDSLRAWCVERGMEPPDESLSF